MMASKSTTAVNTHVPIRTYLALTVLFKKCKQRYLSAHGAFKRPYRVNKVLTELSKGATRTYLALTTLSKRHIASTKCSKSFQKAQPART
jgi:hypothetical protein